MGPWMVIFIEAGWFLTVIPATKFPFYWRGHLHPTVFTQAVVQPLSSGLQEGDIVISTPEVGTLNALSDPRKRWSNGVVAYEINTEFSVPEKTVILNAMAHISARTCITFVQRSTQSDYVTIVDGTGCTSNVGRIGGQQKMTFSRNGCLVFGIIVHELLHALGFWHEHNRSDRNTFITLNWNNVPQGTSNANFQKYATNNLGVAYDYGSIMHYSWNTFAIDPKLPTILPVEKNVIIGQREGMSALDAVKINKFYNCPGPSALVWDGNSAKGCDFFGNDLFAVRATSFDVCRNSCLTASGCTHFTWVPGSGGICFLKKGQVSKSDAFAINDVKSVCGIL